MAVTTTKEKSRQYQAALEGLEAYLETPDGNGGNLYGIQSVFASLGGFEQSKCLYHYSTVLIKLSEETYDFELLSTLELLDLDQRFQDYLNDALKGSPLCSVEELKTYAEGREKENNADPEGAMDCYKNCMSYFDASERYQALRGDMYQQMYDEALEKQNAGDLAGAYFLFSEIAPYDKSEEWKAAIVALLEYTPQTPTDNLLPVTDVEVISSNQTEVVLSWSASKHAKTYEVQYKEGNTDNWTSLGETESTTYTVSGLAASTTYDFRIIAAIDKIKAEGAIVSADTTSTTPAPTIMYPNGMKTRINMEDLSGKIECFALLTDNQLGSFSFAKLLILGEKEYKGSSYYHLLTMANATIDNSNRVVANYNESNTKVLAISDSEGLSVDVCGPLAIEYKDGFILVRCGYWKERLRFDGPWDSDNTLMFYILDSDTSVDTPLLRNIYVYDDEAGKYITGNSFQEDNYEWFSINHKNLVFPEQNEDGTLPGIEKWESISARTQGIRMDLPDEWSFCFVDLDLNDLLLYESSDIKSYESIWALFEINNVDGDGYCTVPVKVR